MTRTFDIVTFFVLCLALIGTAQASKENEIGSWSRAMFEYVRKEQRRQLLWTRTCGTTERTAQLFKEVTQDINGLSHSSDDKYDLVISGQNLMPREITVPSVQSFSFSPDCKWLAVATEDGLNLIDSKTFAQRRISRESGNLKWVDRDQVGIIQDEQIVFVNAETGQESELKSKQSGFSFVDFSFEDGSRGTRVHVLKTESSSPEVTKRKPAYRNVMITTITNPMGPSATERTLYREAIPGWEKLQRLTGVDVTKCPDFN